MPSYFESGCRTWRARRAVASFWPAGSGNAAIREEPWPGGCGGQALRQRLPSWAANRGLELFQGVANREQAGVPKISSGVFVIDPTSKVIMHMYDDRGLDIIAAELNTLRPLFKIFGDWILNSQRHRVEFRFKTSIQELPE
jgi:hypothetical protein